MPLNIYSIFAGSPTTGKSQPIKLSEEFITEVNEAILQRRTPPKTKKD